ncbi:cytochrome P450 [Streptosporangiaceae bacterium NEAU-GS5]|nr:cytochrome P450 [Streptosporangiaceae bacterium NEAU-GS5]
MAPQSVFKQIIDPDSRADPYQFYSELREMPVRREDDGTYVVSTYREIVDLLHDPRISSDRRNLARPAPGEDEADVMPSLSFIGLDSPEHDRLRRLTMRHFGPPHTPGRVTGLIPEMKRIVTELIDGIADRDRIDVVDDIAYPLPVGVICRILGVPHEDEPRFRVWAEAIVETLGPGEVDRAAREKRRVETGLQLSEYLKGLVDARRSTPNDDLLTGLVTYEGPDGRMTPEEIVRTAGLLLIAGHETTVNLITNGMLTLLRNPEMLERLRAEPDMIIKTVEELLRFDPPVHFLSSRVALADIEIGGVTIPAGSPIVLALAAGSRDPAHTPNPDDFDPDRPYNEHLGFGGGVHYCFGAPLARLEAQFAIGQLVARLRNPRLLSDPPPYRPSSTLRGPRHLMIAYDGVLPAAPSW